ncbi:MULTISPECIES: PH domain-containing protein [unclassified Isoptericola]|uniref:PH domain-containing protein n=1 Tax=unclassified Isoptericola TaxID=2623355 RepID=UPI0027135D56|nr:MULTISPECIES: PH domain-containing protein [unclassified Isoptericola]MDO8143865.1 PH domain-containing protein [Isoptericola sp. 178]MDO8149289.1 PH domain-containing protein [Isoptericola sp. b515]MDO8152228.1 PH domain-containing protein [Isoptericola sp. b408]
MTHPAPGPADPFDPPGVTWDRVSPRLIPARLVVVGIWLGLPLVATVLLAVLVTPWLWIATAALVVLLAWVGVLVPRQVRAIGYAERDDDLLIRSGILFRELVVVPYGRMQFVDVTAGPLDRRLNIAKVQLHTASASTDAEIPGLTPDEAERLRDRLTARGEARLAGL